MATRVERTEPPLVVIVGPTASGKTAVAVELAKRLNGEIICADSRTIYRDMDIGTAKPTEAEREAVPHWGVDIVDPDQKFTAADFKQYATEKIAAVRSRGKVPILVGGTGLYIDAIIFNFQFGQAGDEGRRNSLERMTLGELYEYCKNNNISLPENNKNKRYVIRAIERNGQDVRSKLVLSENTIVVGIATERASLHQRIAVRSEQLFAQPVVEEAIMLGKKYGWHYESMTGNIYPLLHQYLKNESSLEEVMQRFKILDWRLAKRQLTWFRRNPYIMWQLKDEVVPYIETALADS